MRRDTHAHNYCTAPGQLKAAGVLAVIVGTSQHPYKESHRPCLMRVTCCKHYLCGIHLLHKLITTVLIGSSNLLAIYNLKQLNLLTLQERDLNMFLHFLTTEMMSSYLGVMGKRSFECATMLATKRFDPF